MPQQAHSYQGVMAGRAAQQAEKRRLSAVALGIFDKYVKNKHRQLDLNESLEMLMTEFDLDYTQATSMFQTFDSDFNGKMSYWEFEQFYNTVGENTSNIIAKFKELDKDNSGKLNEQEARAALRELKSGSGRHLLEKEIDFFIRSTVDDHNEIDLGKFGTLLYKLKLYKNPPPK